MKCNVFKRFIPLVLIAPLAGCSLLNPPPVKVEGRYSSATCVPVCLPLAATVTLTSAPAPTDNKPVTVKDLSERGQSEYIKGMAGIPGQDSAKVFAAAVATPISGGAEPKAKQDLTVFKRQFSVAIAKTKFNPLDRIVAVRVTVVPVGGTFKGWTTAESQYTLITPGTISTKHDAGLELSGDLNLGGAGAVLPKVGTKISNSVSRSESANLQMQTDNLTIGYEPSLITINRDGAVGVELSGNINFTASVVPDRSTDGVIFSAADLSKSPPPKPADVKLTAQKVRVPRGNGDITANVSLTYTVRHVISGGETYEERDDVVEFQTSTVVMPATPLAGATAQSLVILPASEMGQEKYGIALGATPQIALAIKLRDGKSMPLCFDTFDAANEFMWYLLANRTSSVGQGEIGTPDKSNPLKITMRPIAKNAFATLRVMSTCLPAAQ